MSQDIQEVITMLMKMQEQLNFLERKIDTLIKQGESGPSSSGERSFQDRPFREKRFSKPFRPFRPGGHPRKEYGGHEERPEGNRSDRRERGEYGGHGKPFGSGGFKKKPFFSKRKHRD